MSGLLNLLLSAETASSVKETSTSPSLWVTLIIPLIFLILWSFIKYVVAIARKHIEWVQLWAELPVDCLLIWATLIMSRYFIPNQQVAVIYIAFAFILLSLVIAVAVCIYRQYIIDKAGDVAKPKWDEVALHLIGLWAGVIMWLIIILILPKCSFLQTL